MSHFIGILGGLVIFLYGLQKTNTNLRQAFGHKLQVLIEKISHHYHLALLLGIFLTFTMQSSTAATSLLVGLVNTGIMSLSQGMQIIIGTSLGTTIATQIITFNIAQNALILIIVGFALNLLSKKRRFQFTGSVLLGIGFIFLGMNLISTFAEPLKNNPDFIGWIMQLQETPFFVFLLSVLATIILQSSTAMMGLTLSFSVQGIIPLTLAIPVILGSHLGSCTTVLFVGIGKTSQAKTLTFGNLLYKIIGCIVFFNLMKPLSVIATSITPYLPRQIALIHTIIIGGNALIISPFLSYFMLFLHKLFPQSQQEASQYQAKYLDHNLLESPELAIYVAKKEAIRMANTIDEMFTGIMQVFFRQDENLLYKLCKLDKIVDTLSRKIIDYITHLNFNELNRHQSNETYDLLNIISDLEHIGDLIDKDIIPIIEKMIDNELQLSDAGNKEIRKLYQAVYKEFYQSLGAFALGDKRLAEKSLLKNQVIIQNEQKMRRSHINRLHQGVELSRQTSSIHFEMINILKQISLHSASIAKIIFNQT